MAKDFRKRLVRWLFFTAIALAVMVWGGLKRGYFAQLSPVALWGHVLGLAALWIGASAVIAAGEVMEADQKAKKAAARSAAKPKF
jgi:hypothetical protein